MKKFWPKRVSYLILAGICIAPLNAVYAAKNDELLIYFYNQTDMPLVTLPITPSNSFYPDSDNIAYTFNVQGANSSGSFQGSSTPALFDIWRTANYPSNYTASLVRVGWDTGSGYVGCDYTITCDKPTLLSDGTYGCANLYIYGNPFSESGASNGWLSNTNCMGSDSRFSGGTKISITKIS